MENVYASIVVLMGYTQAVVQGYSSELQVKWLQERGVLPWRRQDLPLLVDAEQRVVAIADLGRAAEFAAEPGEPSWRLTWHGRGIVTESDAFGFKWPGRPPIG